MSKKILSSILVVAGVLALDQLTKFIVVSSMKLYSSIPVIDDILRITYIHNPNSVFGISLGGRFPYPVMILLLVAVVAVIWAFEKKPSYYLLYSAIIGGALGNFIDRMRFGEVIDFIDVGISKTTRWPVFNIADASISVSVVLLLYLSLKSSKEKRDEDITD